MKKILSVLMALIMAMTCFGVGTISASADETADILKAMSKAETIKLNESKSISINSQSDNLIDTIGLIKVIPETTGYYAFTCDTQPASGMVLSTIVPLDEEEDTNSGVGMAGTGAETPKFCVAAKLTAKKTYFFMITGSECGKYTTNVKMTKHSHTYGEVSTWAAYYEYDADFGEVFSWDGSKSQPCLYCGYEKTIERYYAPKTVTLKYKSTTYDGKAKKPSVTVKDRKGNVIASSNYKVTYKNNTKPGQATVTIKFNGKKYDGVMTKTFTIKPKKATLSSVKSGKSKKLTVNWSKDKNVAGYQVQYSTSSKFTKNTTKSATVSGSKNTSKTISKLKGGKKYYARVRSYVTVDGKKVYGSWSSYKSATVKK